MVHQTLVSLVADPDTVDDSMVEEAYQLARRPGAWQAFERTARDEVRHSGRRTDFTDRLGDLAVPTLVVHGESDPVVPVGWARRAAERIPGARLAVLPGVGHLAPREAPGAFNVTVTSFLTEAVSGQDAAAASTAQASS
jgi:pimeloyl-ACP methyl ester carboxylesterase